jgi:hypothetical protein
MMGTGKPEVPDELGPPAGEAARPAPGRGSLDDDTLYLEALEHVQRGRWAEAEDALGELMARYPGAEELARLQHELALHLSAERTWLAGMPKGRSKFRLPKRLPVRLLLAADLVLYLLVATIWLLGYVRQWVR